jgi:RNA polymerase sigma factor (sigma-70 family)
MERDRALAKVLRVLAVKPKEEDAWRELYGILWPFVLASTYRKLRGHREIAIDASQEVFLRMVRYCDFRKLQSPDVFRSYVKSMCLNVSRTYLKQASKYGADTSEQGLENLELLSRFPAPEDMALANDFFKSILGDLGNSEIHRIILLRVIQGYTLEEIAAECHLSYAATAVRLHRLRQKLYLYMTEQGPASRE